MGEVFRQVGQKKMPKAIDEASLVRDHLLEKASPDLALRFKAVVAYEGFCSVIETGFDWLRHLSSRAGARSIGPGDFAEVPEVQKMQRQLGKRLRAAVGAISKTSAELQREFTSLAEYFDVSSTRELFEALLRRHAEVQRKKPPDGKREWFERGADNSIFVRSAYRLENPPPERVGWGRPYRIEAVRSFCRDLRWH